MKACILSIFSFLSMISYSQTQGISYAAAGRGAATTFVNDYHALGINSSALGWREFEKRHITIGSSEMAFAMYSDSLNVSKLKSLYGAIKNEVTGKKDESGTWQQQRQFAQEYANAGVDISFQYNWFGFSAQYDRLGGIAVNITENYNWYSRLNETTTGILFEGKFANYFDSLTVVFGSDTSKIANREGISQDTLAAVIKGTISNPLSISTLTQGSSIKARWDRHYNFGYGRKLFGKDSLFVLYGGIGGRFIQSIAMFDFESDGSGARFYSSLSPSFDIEYGSVSNSNPSTYDGNSGALPKSVGNGYGIDLSVSARIFNKILVAAAVNNIGQVTYKRNVYTLNDTLVGEFELSGLDDYNITQSTNALLKDGGLLNLEGVEEHVVKNAANVRFGGSWDLGKLNVGVDFVAPFDRTNPGSIANPVMALGGDLKLIKYVTFSAGYFGGGIYKHNIPVGFRFHIKDGMYEFGVSSRDVLSFFTQNSNSISTAFGFLRFRF